MAPEADRGRVVQELWADLHPVLAQLEPVPKRALVSLWGRIRAAISGLEGQVLDLEAQVMRRTHSRAASVATVSTISRPPTSDSVLARRADLEASLDDAAEGTVAENVILAIKDLDPVWVQGKLAAYRSRGKEEAGDPRFGPEGTCCWYPSQESGHDRGYVRVNWRNTAGPSGVKIGVNPYLHQLAVVAAGQGQRLTLASKNGGYHVSHLCHNTACMNPVHVIIESAQKNQSRKPCNGAVKLRFPDGSIVDPCKCAHDGSRPCILPTWSKPSGKGFWVFTEDGPVQRG